MTDEFSSASPPVQTVLSFVARLVQATQPERAAVWDPVGLQLGDPGSVVARAAVCHEVTEEVVEKLLDDPPDVLVVYHPLLFHSTTRLVAGPTAAGRAFRLIGAGIAVVVTHTDFDAAPGGAADALADTLGLQAVTGFGSVPGEDQIKVVTFVPEEAADAVVAAMSHAGAGRIGNYTHCSFRSRGEGRFLAGEAADPVIGRRGEVTGVAEAWLEMVAPRRAEDAVVAALVAAHPYEEPAFDVYDSRSNQAFFGRVGDWSGSVGGLAETVAERFGRSGLRVAGRMEGAVERVAVVPGSGASFLGAAAHAGADVIVTGDVDHHRAVAAVDSGLAVLDPGHAATELPGMRRLVGLVAELGVDVVDLTGDGSGPWVEMVRG